MKRATATDAKEIMNASSSKPDAAPATGTRLTLDDPDLYHRLMKECSEEERSIAGPVAASGPYVAPSFVTEYLKQNDVRPLKKVFILLNPVNVYTFLPTLPDVFSEVAKVSPRAVLLPPLRLPL